MADVVDSSIVELDLDNEQFKKHVNESIDLLRNNFQRALEEFARTGEQASHVVVEGMKDVATQAGQIDLSGIGDKAKSVVNYLDGWNSSVGKIKTKLNSLLRKELTRIPRAVEKTSNLVFGLIKSGGLSRALNLERAQFQMEGLGISWEKALQDINYGVQDTAYGLDSAARAASQLSASGVKLGDDMKAALRGISGVAAMTSSSYDDIAYIFTAVAGMGKATAQQLNRLSIRGINAFATLADYLHKTQAEVRDMVSKGEIDFDTFAKAMDSAFGEHAKDANKTFEGALSNVKAALSRIGAELATPYYDAARDVLNALRLLIKDIKTYMDPALDTMGRTIEIVGAKLTAGVEAIQKSFDHNAFDGLRWFFESINSFLESNAFVAIQRTIQRVSEWVGAVFKDISKFVDQLVYLIKPAFNQAAKLLENFVNTTGTTIRFLFQGVISLFKRLSPIIEPIVWGMSDAFGIVVLTLEHMKYELYTIGNTIAGLANPIAEVIKPLAGPLYKTIVTIGQVIANIIGHIVDVVEGLLPLITSIVNIVSGQIKIWLLRIQRIANYISAAVTAISDNLGPMITKAAAALGKLGDLVWNIAGGIQHLFNSVWKKLFGDSQGAIESLMDGLGKVFDQIYMVLDTVEPILKNIAQNIAYALGYAYGTLTKILGVTGPIGEWVDKGFHALLQLLVKSLGFVGELIKGLTFIFTGKFIGSEPVPSKIVGAIIHMQEKFIEFVAWCKENLTLTNIFATLISGIKGLVGEITYLFSGKYVTDVKKLEDGTTELIYDNSKSKIAKLIEWIKTAFATLGINIGQSMFTGILGGLEGLGKALIESITGTPVSAATLDELSEEELAALASSDTKKTNTTKTKPTIGGAAASVAKDAAASSATKTGETTDWGGIWEAVKSGLTTLATKTGEFATVLFSKEGLDTLDRVIGIIKPIAIPLIIGKIVKKAFKSISGIFKPFEGILKPLENILKPLESVSKNLGKFTFELGNNAKDILKSVTSISKAVNKKIKRSAFKDTAEGLLMISAAIGVLSGSVLLISKYGDIDKINGLLPMFTVMISGLLMLAKAIQLLKSTRPSESVQLLADLVPTAKKTLGSLKSLIDSFKISSFLKSFAISVGLLALGIKAFTTINFTDAVKAAVIYGVFMLEVAGANRLAGSAGFGNFPITFAASVGVLAWGIKAFGDIDWYTAYNAMIIYGRFLGELVLAQGLLKLFKADSFGSFSISFALSVPLLAIGVRSFNGINFVDALPMLEVCAVFFLGIAAISGLINKQKATILTTIQTLLIIAEMFVVFEGIALTVSLMTMLDTDKVKKIAESLAMVLGGFAAIEIGSIATAWTKGSVVLMFVLLLGEVAGGLYWLSTNLKKVQVEKFDILSDSITKLIGASALFMVLTGIAGKLFPSLVSTILEIAIITTLFGSVIGMVIALIGSNEGLMEAVNTGLPTFISLVKGIGEALGGFFGEGIGAIGGGLGKAVGNFESERIAAGLSGLSENLGDTTEAINAFADGVNSHINKETVTLLSSFAGSIRELAKAGKKDKYLLNINNRLLELGNSLPKFAEAVRGLTVEDKAAISDASSLLTTLGKAVRSIPESGGLLQKLLGEHDGEKFKTDLKAVGEGIAEFYVALTTYNGQSINIDTDFVTESATAMKALAAATRYIPESGGGLQSFIGSVDISKFGDDLEDLGTGLMKYYTALSAKGLNFDPKFVEASANGAKALAELANNLPSTGGVWQEWFGEKNLAQFGFRVSSFGKFMAQYYDAIKDIKPTNAEHSDKVTGVGMLLSELENSLPLQNGAVYKFVFGEQNLELFGDRIVKWAQKLQDYEKEITKVDFTKLEGGTSFLSSIGELFNSYISVSSSGALDLVFQSVNNLVESFANAMGSVDNTKKLQNAGKSVLTSFLSGIDNEEAKAEAGKKLDSILKLLCDSLPYNTTFETQGFGSKLLTKINSAISKAINDDNGTFTNVGAKILGLIKSAISSLGETLTSIGKNIARGLALGMRGSESTRIVVAAGNALGRAAIQGIRTGAGVHSPSTEAYLVGDYVGEGLILGLQDVESPVYLQGQALGKAVVQGVSDGVTNANIANPLDTLTRIFGGDERLINLSLQSALKTDPKTYEAFGSAFADLLNRGVNYDTLSNIAKLYGSNSKKLMKVVYDFEYAKWDEKTMGPRKYTNWLDMYNATLNPTEGRTGADAWSVLEALINKFGVEFEESGDLSEKVLTSIQGELGETNNELEETIRLLDDQLYYTLREISNEFNAMRTGLDVEFGGVASEVLEAQRDFLALQNSPLASDEDLSVAYRRLNILQGSLESLDRRRELLSKEEEERKKLAKLQNENAKKEAEDNAKTASSATSAAHATDALGFSASDTGSKLEDAAEDADTFAESLGNLDDVAGVTAQDLLAYKDDYGRAGYELADAFQEDGWWKSFLDGSESGLAGYDLGSILAGNTITGVDDALGDMGLEGWNLGDYFMQGLNDATLGEGGGLLGWTSDITTTIESALGDIDFSVGGIMDSIGSKVEEALGGIGLSIDGIKQKIIDFFSGFGIDITTPGGAISSLGTKISDWLKSTFGIDIEYDAASVEQGINGAITNFTGGIIDLGAPIEAGQVDIISPNSVQPAASTNPVSNPNIVYDIDPDMIVIDPDAISTVVPVSRLSMLENNTGYTGTRNSQLLASLGDKARESELTLSGTLYRLANKSGYTSIDTKGIETSLNRLDRTVQGVRSDIQNTGLILDTGTVVGEISRPMSKSMNNLNVLERRGI